MKSTIRLATFLFALSAVLPVRAQAPASDTPVAKGLRVFHIGNSFTEHGNIPDSLHAMAIQRGKTGATVGRNIRWGANLSTHAEPPYSLNNYGFTPWKIALVPEKKWDVLILQTWDSGELARDVHFASMYMAAALSGNPDCQTYLYYFGPKLAETPEKCLPASKLSYIESLADALSAKFPAAKPVLIIPAGIAQWEVREAVARGEIPGIQDASAFFDPDNHFSNLGAHIVALTHFATLYGESPEGMEPRSGPPKEYWAKAFPPEACAVIQRIVWDVVQKYPRSGVSDALLLPGRSLPSATAGQPYTATPVRIGGNPPFQWSLVSGKLPAGLTFDSASGQLRGTPVAPSESDLEISVRDSEKKDATARLALKVDAPAIPPKIAWVGAGPAVKSTPGAAVELAAEASDADGTIAKVEFFADGESVGSSTAAPWKCNIPGDSPLLASGKVLLTACATDNAGLTASTPPHERTVGDPAAEMDIPYFVPPGPTIDGEIDALWSTAVSITADKVLFGEAAPDLAPATARFGWNERFFFALVEVPDSNLTFVGDEWNKVEDGDSIRITLDSDARDAATKEGKFTPSDVDMFFRWGSPTISDKINQYAGLDFYLVKLPDGRKGRLLEVKITWELLGVTPSPGRRVGLDFRNHDDDKDGPVERILGHVAGNPATPRAPGQLVRFRLAPPAR